MLESAWARPPSSGPPDGSKASTGQAPISSAARRWSGLWNQIDLTGAKPIGRGSHVRAGSFGPPVELIPQFFDLTNGRRFITLGIKYDSGPGMYRRVDSVGFGQFVNLPFADWEIGERVWQALRTGEAGVSFSDLSAINGNFDPATKASDRFIKDQWIQRVWELKVQLEMEAQEQTRAAVERIAKALRAHPGAAEAMSRGGVELPASLLGPDAKREAVARFRINQGMYGDHSCFIERPVDGMMQVHALPSGALFERASELSRDLKENWLDLIRDALDNLLASTAGKEGASLALAIESADTVRKLNVIVETFWSMWNQPLFSANAEFEVVTDPQRRAAKYMEILVQRTLRILLKQSVEEIGFYPYVTVDRSTYPRKILSLEEALRRTSRILDLYGKVETVPAFKEATEERNRLVQEFQQIIRHGLQSDRKKKTAGK